MFLTSYGFGRPGRWPVMEVLEWWVRGNDYVLWLFEREFGLKRMVSYTKI